MKEARLNVQGLARRDKGFASCIVADAGRMLVGMDLGAGEPTCTAHYSRDAMYRYATLDGIGKAPYWQDGALFIDDIYLMVAASTPVGRPHMEAAWAQTWPGGSFVEQWLAKPKVIKSALDDTRQLHKMTALALGYGMGATKMQKQVYEQFGVELTAEQCKGIHEGYWRTFAGVKAFARRCQERAAANGSIVNDFGYRVTFIATGNRDATKGPLDSTHKAYNALIQSSVSGIMHVFNMFLFEETSAAGVGARFISIVHDETIADVPSEQLEQFDKVKERAVDRLNKYLQWTVPIRVGFTSGPTFYDLKG